MNNFILLLFCMLIISLPSYAFDEAMMFDLQDGEQVKIFDEYGTQEGSYRRQGDKIIKYDNYGNQESYFEEANGRVKHLDNYGNLEGYYSR